MRFLFFLIIISITVIVVFENINVLGQKIPTIDELNTRAFELNREGKFEESISILNKALDQKIDWIYPWLVIGGLAAAGLIIPLVGAFGAVHLSSHITEWWWYKYWKGKLGIDPLKTKIIEQTIERPLAH